MADFLLGFAPRIDTAPDFASSAGGESYTVDANAPPVAAGPGNAHPSHTPPSSGYEGATKNPTYAGSLYPTGM